MMAHNGRPARGVAHLVDTGADDYLDALVGESPGRRLSDVVVLVAEQRRALVQDRDLGTEAVVDRGEFNTEIAAAQQRQPIRQRIGSDQIGTGDQPRAVAQAGDVGNHWFGTGADDDGFGAHRQPVHARADLDGTRVGEHRAAGDHSYRVDIVEHREVAAAQPCGQGVHRANRAGAPAARVISATTRLGLVHQRLGGHATDVDTGAAIHPIGLLHQDDATPERSQSRGGGHTAPAVSNDQKINIEGLGTAFIGVILGPVPPSRMRDRPWNAPGATPGSHTTAESHRSHITDSANPN
jgi:hypothetical protein